jgi:hypothetical protein
MAARKQFEASLPVCEGFSSRLGDADIVNSDSMINVFMPELATKITEERT